MRDRSSRTLRRSRARRWSRPDETRGRLRPWRPCSRRSRCRRWRRGALGAARACRPPSRVPPRPASTPGAATARGGLAVHASCCVLAASTAGRPLERLLGVGPGPVTDPGGPAPGTDPPPTSTPDAPAPPRFVSVAAREFSLTLSRPLVGAGAVTVELRNSGEDPHNLVVSPDGTHSPLATLLRDRSRDLRAPVGDAGPRALPALVLARVPRGPRDEHHSAGAVARLASAQLRYLRQSSSSSVWSARSGHRSVRLHW